MLLFRIPTGRLDKPEAIKERLKDKIATVPAQETPKPPGTPLLHESDNNFYFQVATRGEEKTSDEEKNIPERK